MKKKKLLSKLRHAHRIPMYLIKKLAIRILRKEISVFKKKHLDKYRKLETAITDNDEALLLQAMYNIETDRGKEMVSKSGKSTLISEDKGNRAWTYPVEITFEYPKTVN